MGAEVTPSKLLAVNYSAHTAQCVRPGGLGARLLTAVKHSVCAGGEMLGSHPGHGDILGQEGAWWMNGVRCFDGDGGEQL